MSPALLIRLTALGDVLLAVPAARALAARYGEVHWVLHRRWEELSEFLPAKVHFLSGPADILPLGRRLRRLGISPDSVFDLQGKPLTFLLCATLGGSADRYTKRSLSENLNAWRGIFPLRPQNPDQVWKRYLRIVQTADIEHPHPALVLSESYLEECRHFLEKVFPSCPPGFTAFHPGASHPGKRFTPESTAWILNHLSHPILLIGDRPDPVIPIPGSALVFDGRGLIPLRLLPGVLKLSSGLITSDSGPMHLGRAVEIPLVACFFQTDPLLGFAPVPGGRLHLVSRPLACKPCSLHGQRSVCPTGTWECRTIDWASETAFINSFLYHS